MAKDFRTDNRALSRLSRRAWLLSTFGLGISAPPSLRVRSPVAMAQSQAAPAAGEVIGMNKEASPSSLNAVKDGITPVDQFYVRDHFGSQEISMADWKLRIEGRVANRVEFTFSDLLAAPTKKLEALLECTGNKQLLVSNGIWEGVPMSYLLEQAAPTRDAQQVMLEGSDTGPLMPGYPGLFYRTKDWPAPICLPIVESLRISQQGLCVPGIVGCSTHDAKFTS